MYSSLQKSDSIFDDMLQDNDFSEVVKEDINRTIKLIYQRAAFDDDFSLVSDLLNQASNYVFTIDFFVFYNRISSFDKKVEFIINCIRHMEIDDLITNKLYDRCLSYLKISNLNYEPIKWINPVGKYRTVYKIINESLENNQTKNVNPYHFKQEDFVKRADNASIPYFNNIDPSKTSEINSLRIELSQLKNQQKELLDLLNNKSQPLKQDLFNVPSLKKEAIFNNNNLEVNPPISTIEISQELDDISNSINNLSQDKNRNLASHDLDFDNIDLNDFSNIHDNSTNLDSIKTVSLSPTQFAQHHSLKQTNILNRIDDSNLKSDTLEFQNQVSNPFIKPNSNLEQEYQENTVETNKNLQTNQSQQKELDMTNTTTKRINTEALDKIIYQAPSNLKDQNLLLQFQNYMNLVSNIEGMREKIDFLNRFNKIFYDRHQVIFDKMGRKFANELLDNFEQIQVIIDFYEKTNNAKIFTNRRVKKLVNKTFKLLMSIVQLL